MKLQKIIIEEIPSWKDDAGKYEGSISYEGTKGEIMLKLDSRLSEALLLCIGQTVEQFAANAASELKASIAQSIQEANAPKTIAA